MWGKNPNGLDRLATVMRSKSYEFAKLSESYKYYNQAPTTVPTVISTTVATTVPTVISTTVATTVPTVVSTTVSEENCTDYKITYTYADGINIREKPSTSAKILDVVYKDNIIKRCSTINGNWQRVQLKDNTYAWIYKTLIP